VRTPERGVSEAESVGVQGFACEAGVSGWRPETPTGLSEDGLPSKDNTTTPYKGKMRIYGLIQKHIALIGLNR
jgi:hypothetical protein